MRKSLLVAGLSACLASAAFGSGYQVSLQGQKQIGMGHTGTGLAWDASSIFFNPGALGFLKKSNVIIGMSFVSDKVAFRGATPRDTTYLSESPVATPFAAYAAFKLKNIPLAFGIGVNTPFGSIVKWSQTGDNQFLLRQLTLQAICVQPTVSYNISDVIGIGAGFTYAFGKVNLQRGVPVYTNQGFSSAELSGKASGIGFNAGLFLKPSEKFSIGLDYRSKIDMKVKDGDAKFSVPPSLSPSVFPPNGATTFNASLPLPSVASIGIGIMPNEKLTLAADFNYTFWSAYKSLRFDYAESVNGATFTESPRNYKNSYAARVGLDYKVIKMLSVRCGGHFDKTPVKDGYMTLETPDASRIGLSLGVGLRPIENLAIDASLLFINGMKREQTQADVDAAGTNDSVLPGTYRIRAVIPGISIGYSF